MKNEKIKNLIKNFFILILLFFVILNIYFGVYLPFKKSTYLIYGLRLLQTDKIKNLNEFKEVFSKILNFKSYIGQEETVKVIAQYLVYIINNEAMDQKTAKFLIDFFEPYFIEKEFFHLILFSRIYDIYYLISGDDVYFKKVENIYLSMIERAPQFPVGYISLFDFYFNYGKYIEAKKVGEKILNYWPNYLEIKEKIDKIN